MAGAGTAVTVADPAPATPVDLAPADPAPADPAPADPAEPEDSEDSEDDLPLKGRKIASRPSRQPAAAKTSTPVAVDATPIKLMGRGAGGSATYSYAEGDEIEALVEGTWREARVDNVNEDDGTFDLAFADGGEAERVRTESMRPRQNSQESVPPEPRESELGGGDVGRGGERSIERCATSTGEDVVPRGSASTGPAVQPAVQPAATGGAGKKRTAEKAAGGKRAATAGEATTDGTTQKKRRPATMLDSWLGRASAA